MRAKNGNCKEKDKTQLCKPRWGVFGLVPSPLLVAPSFSSSQGGLVIKGGVG